MNPDLRQRVEALTNPTAPPSPKVIGANATEYGQGYEHCKADVLAILGAEGTEADILARIAVEYPAVAGPDDCPPAPHACPKCEIYHLLNTTPRGET